MSDHFIPRNYSLREQDVIPDDEPPELPCPYRLPDHYDDAECWSSNCTLAAFELLENLKARGPV
jgi:hypothetical protein